MRHIAERERESFDQQMCRTRENLKIKKKSKQAEKLSRQISLDALLTDAQYLLFKLLSAILWAPNVIARSCSCGEILVVIFVVILVVALVVTLAERYAHRPSPIPRPVLAQFRLQYRQIWPECI